MKYNWLLFDADGTLFDYDKAELIALKTTFEYTDTPFSDFYHQRYRHINDGLFKDLEKRLITSIELRTKRFELLFSEFKIDLDVKEFSDKYLQNISNNSTLITGALETIRSLYPQYKMLLVTNGIADVQRPRFDNSEIRRYFENIIISDEVGFAKPATEFFDIAFKTIGQPSKKDVMIIGDSLTSDMAGGMKYGIDTCWYNPHQVKNERNVNITYEIFDLHELLKMLSDT
jgi:YjjG family noncanonical pyrimidine nucleotidase